MLTGLMAPNVLAQAQIPNSDFEGEWINCVPWTSKNNTKEVTQEYKNDGIIVNGIMPKGWCISHVIGINGVGATLVGRDVKAEGYESATAVKLTNSPNSILATQIVPGYMTLGTTWSTSVMGKQNDGGSFGGIEFTGRPTAIEFMYKRERGTVAEGQEDKTIKPDEKTTIVAYLWKGHWTQKSVPGEIGLFGTPASVDMVDRDRCVLGMDMTNSKGGEVTASEDAELIAVMTAEITENASEWTKFHGDFEYKSDATPEMINIIIAAGDYFGGADVVGKDNSLTVDNVNLLYAESNETSYNGYLNIEMMGSKFPEDQPATIKITKTGDNKCDFLLPQLTLEMGGSPMALGDINLKDVEMTTADGVTTYKGAVKDMSLMGGGITADVNLDGTIDAKGVADMKISVMWQGVPINVTFTTNPAQSGIGSIVADENAPVEYFNLQGVKVSADRLTPGLYIKRQGKTVSKVILK